MTIIIPFRPSIGGLDSPQYPLHQNEKGEWLGENGDLVDFYKIVDCYRPGILYRAVKALRKNSVYKHRIIIAIDSDMTYHPNWLKQLGDGVEVFKSSNNYGIVPQVKQANVTREVILSRPDDEIICYAYISDLVCEKYWDKYIIEAYQQHGDKYVYLPMFVEPRTTHGANTSICGEKVKDLIEGMGELTNQRIWNEWRNKYCCHALTLKPPSDRDYIKESDIDEWSVVCNQGREPIIFEKCGERKYGYWAPMICSGKRMKERVHHLSKGFGGDLDFEASFGEKAIITKSHVFHFHLDCKLDDVEVNHA